MVSTIASKASTTIGQVSGAYALIDSLVRHGVKHVFGYPGGAILPIYDELYKAEEKGLIRPYFGAS